MFDLQSLQRRIVRQNLSLQTARLHLSHLLSNLIQAKRRSCVMQLLYEVWRMRRATFDLGLRHILYSVGFLIYAP